MTWIANVIIRHKSKFVDREYSYCITDDLKGKIKVGSLVWVPFGLGDKMYEAIVTSMEEGEEEERKYIAQVSDKEALSEKKLDLARWIREQYMSSFNEALSLFIPKDKDVGELQEHWLVPSVSNEQIEQALAKERKTARNKRMLLELLLQGEFSLSKVQKELDKSLLEAAKSVEHSGLATMQTQRVFRIPQNEYRIEQRNITLNQEQQQISEAIQENVQKGVGTLLYGITGSGKTEVYIQLIKNCIQRHRQAIVLVPEISLTPQTIARFKNIFGDRIAVFHSQISQGERKDQMDLIKQGKMDIIIGARSALFSPLERIGLIIIDECHDDAYKSEQSPRYDSIEVAQKMAEVYGAGLVLGTATPTVEQYYEAVYGKLDLQVLKQRQKGQLPTVEIVDTFEERKKGNASLISDKTINAIQQEINDGKQAILFLNKRGYAATLSCNQCNHTIMCPSCDISLTYHKEGQKLLCHYCGHSEAYEKKCRSCGKGEYRYLGYGTQRIEDEINARIVGAKVIRLDRDTTKLKGGHEKLLTFFKEEKANVLIGTQMISKGLDFEKVSLVVILNADQGLRFPDYRSAEKTLSTMIQVSGRAGRGQSGGRVIIQTDDTKNKIFDFALKQDYPGFFWEEIKERKAFVYPPFSSLIRIQFSSLNQRDCAETAERMKDAVAFYLKKRNKEVITLGPVPNLIQRIENKFRWQLFYKVERQEDVSLLKRIIGFILSEKRSIIVKKGVAVSTEINPKTLI